MRPLRLDVEGFGTFRDPVTLDFSDTDFFALVGPTGSGKTTVIDAICFALYGSAPRWPRKNQVSLALAPSTSHARVALIFEVAGKTFAAVRVLARAAKGQVSTKQSRLISLPVELSLDGDLGDLLDQELEPLADSPDSMNAAVTALLGLTFEHFTQSVVLPQGGFAKFLHAEKRERQDLLVSLLGLSVYETVAQRANQLAKDAGVRAGTLTEELCRYADATEAAEEAAESRHSELAALEAGLHELLTPWRDAEVTRSEAKDAAAGHEVSLAALATVTAPNGLPALGGARTSATAVLASAEKAESEADAALDAAEGAAAAAGDVATWKQLIDNHARRVELTAREATAAADAGVAAAALEQASSTAEAADADLEAARAAREHVRIAHRADDLAAKLVAGEACPVCLQIVATLPDRPAHEGLAEADARVSAAEKTHKASLKAMGDSRFDHDRASDALARLKGDLAALGSQLEGQPGAAAAKTSYGAAMAAAATLATAIQAARTAREATRRAREALKALDERWADAGRRLGHTRDGVAQLAPPESTGDHVADWEALTTWARAKADEVTAQAAELEKKCALAEQEEVQQRAAVLDVLRGTGIAAPARFTEVAVNTAVVKAVSDATAALTRIRERREIAQRLEEEINKQQTTEVLHKELGSLLSARNFERWMVEEALQAMMIEASANLSQLSGGQFELVIDDKQDILVVDHNDASSLRPVQTLSGGETFQASLALALALSSQIAALSPHTGQLDTVLLDEGFGTLDPSTLDVVASTLEQLAGGGERTVGVVTHVAALAERVPVQFKVHREGSRSSIEKVWA
jgi:DNA repair protein SbcC/Rad50